MKAEVERDEWKWTEKKMLALHDELSTALARVKELEAELSNRMEAQ